MTVHTLAETPPALAEACRQAGLSADGARLLRSFANTVYHLPAEGVVVRLAETGTPGKYDRLVTSLKVARWLHEQEFPVTLPLDVRQPLAVEGCLATFWHYEEDGAGDGDPVPLGVLLRWLHSLPPAPFALPTYDPFGRVRRAVRASLVLDGEERDWLLGRCAELEETYYERVEFALPYGLIHGDAHRGNLIHTRDRVLLCDWDSVSAGPREIDLVPTLQGARFGLSDAQRDGFARAYGRDIRDWPGYPVLRDIRELQTLTAVLRIGHRDAAALAELRHRLASLRAGDDRLWHPF